jgi:hypothetical protein
MKTIELLPSEKLISDYIKESKKQTIIFTKKRKPIAAIISLGNIDDEALALSSNEEFLEIIQNARKEFRAGKKLSLVEMKKEISVMN